MKGEWLDQSLCRSWAAQVEPFGDYYRRAILVPLTVAVCKHLVVAPNEFPNISNFIDHAVATYDVDATSGRRSSILSGLRCYEFGAGEGYLGRILANLGAQYFGSDFSPYLVELGSKKSHSKLSGHYSLIEQDVENLSVDDLLISQTVVSRHDTTSSLLMFHSLLEHIADKMAFLAKLHDLSLRSTPKPALFFSVLNPAYFKCYGDASEGRQVTVSLGGTGCKVSVSFCTKKQIEETLLAAGWRISGSLTYDALDLDEEKILENANGLAAEFDLSVSPFEFFLAMP